MTWSAAFVVALSVLALLLFISNRFPIDQVAISIPVILLLTGILTPAEAVAGFSDPATITVAAMLVLSMGLTKTGAVATLALWVQRWSMPNPTLKLLLACAAAALVSPFLNNTAVVVLFLPVFVSMANDAQQPPSLYLIPLSYVAILGGTMTLIGTSTNLIVAAQAQARGLGELHMFSIAPLGAIYLLCGMTYLFTVGRSLLPLRSKPTELSEKYDVRRFMTELQVRPESPVISKSLVELDWRQRYGVTLHGIARGQRTIWNPSAEARLREGDILYVEGDTAHLLRLADKLTLATPSQQRQAPVSPRTNQRKLVEVMIGPSSPLVGRTLRQTRFQQRYNATVLGLQHHEVTVRERLISVPLSVGDLLLLEGSPAALHDLAEKRGFVPLSEVSGARDRRPRAVVAAAIMLAVVLAAASGAVSIMTAALVGVVVMLFSGCLHIRELYTELDWMVVFLLAGLIPLGIAMDKTGAAAFLGSRVATGLAGYGPHLVIGVFYIITSLLTEVMSNNAAAVVLTPIAIVTAQALHMNPYALLVATMFGASASFMTPVGYQTNTLVYGPGNYRFTDYLKVGAPLNLLLLMVATICIPLFWPSSPS